MFVLLLVCFFFFLFYLWWRAVCLLRGAISMQNGICRASKDVYCKSGESSEEDVRDAAIEGSL